MASLHFLFLAAVLVIAAAAPPANTPESPATNSLDKKRVAEEACRHIAEQDICHELCLLKSYGAVDDAGRYMESAAADILAIQLPKHLQVEEHLKQAAKSCNSVNNHIVEGCGRAGQISECLQTEFDKIVHRDSRAAKSAAASKTCVDVHDSCHKSCVLTSFGVLDNGRINTTAAIDLLAVNYPTLTLNKLEQMARSCNGVNKRYVGCEGASELATCFEEKYVNILKETGKQT